MEQQPVPESIIFSEVRGLSNEEIDKLNLVECLNVKEPPVSRAVIIDHTYRLQAADIGQQFMRVQIVSVSLQGLEESKPMLHLATEMTPWILRIAV